jgi:hypothetical protein
VRRVLAEVRGDRVGVARVEGLVVGADVVEVPGDARILADPVDFGVSRSSSF